MAKNHEESNADRFKRIATKRANRILDDLRLLGNCANRAIYKYEDSQVKQIFAALEKELKHVKSLFSPGRNRKIEL